MRAGDTALRAGDMQRACAWQKKSAYGRAEAENTVHNVEQKQKRCA